MNTQENPVVLSTRAFKKHLTTWTGASKIYAVSPYINVGGSIEHIQILISSHVPTSCLKDITLLGQRFSVSKIRVLADDFKIIHYFPEKDCPVNGFIVREVIDHKNCPVSMFLEHIQRLNQELVIVSKSRNVGRSHFEQQYHSHFERQVTTYATSIFDVRSLAP